MPNRKRRLPKKLLEGKNAGTSEDLKAHPQPDSAQEIILQHVEEFEGFHPFRKSRGLRSIIAAAILSPIAKHEIEEDIKIERDAAMVIISPFQQLPFPVDHSGILPMYATTSNTNTVVITAYSLSAGSTTASTYSNQV
jgi:hypothetical protein